MANAGGTGAVTDSVLDAAGTRFGTKTSGTLAWLVPDLHGSTAAGLAGDGTSISDALRYDGYGVTLAAWPSGGSGATAHWKYQGRLDLVPGAPDAGTPSLYDAGFREYAPSLGAFTSLDDLAGSAQDPSSLNRFLYAAANPATLVDPDGHCGTRICNIDGIGEPDWAPVRGPGAGTRSWLDDHARVVAYQRLARTMARAATHARTAAVRTALAGQAVRHAERAVTVARTAKVQADMAAYQPGPAEVVGMGAATFGGGLAATTGATAVIEEGVAVGGAAWTAASDLVASVWAGLTTAGPAGACAMGLCPAGLAIGKAALEGAGGSPVSPGGAVADAVDDVAGPVVRGIVSRSGDELLPAALTTGRNAEAGVGVYIGSRAGAPVYVGISNSLSRRATEHSGRFPIEALTDQAVLRGEARAIEQAMIVRNPGFENIINSISPLHDYYESAVHWGEAWLTRHGY